MMETASITTTLIKQRWRLCIFVSSLGCLILISLLKYQYQDPNRSPFQIIRSTRTAASTTAITTLTTITKSQDLSSTYKPSINKHHQYVNHTFNHKYDKLLMNESKKECNIFKGKWVYNPKENTSYKESQCPFLSDQVTCRRNGRVDFEYEKWMWEGEGCENIPRWNGKEILERLRGKRVIIVGDSLNRNQWESLSCLLYSSIPSKGAYVHVRNGNYKIFKAKDYNCTVEFYWSPFLVELEETKPNGLAVLKLDTISPSANQWQGADIMVFNTGHWWNHHGKLQAWKLFKHKDKFLQNMEVELAFDIAMKTWANWVDKNVDSAKTTVVFRSISPEHKGEQWCHNQTQPIQDNSYIPIFPRPLLKVVEKTIREMRTPVTYLNITKLSEYRKDAHPTVYTSKQGKLLTMEQRQKPEVYADCNHWCLPGVPDTWNSLLFTSLFFDSSRDIL